MRMSRCKNSMSYDRIYVAGQKFMSHDKNYMLYDKNFHVM